MENKKELNLDLLYNSPDYILIELRNEANENLKSIHDSENIITNKANGLLQVLFPVFVLIIGFIITELSNFKTSKLLFFASLLEIIIFLTCFFLFDILVIKKTSLLGSKPSNLLEHDILDQPNEELNKLHYLRIRVFSLENAIKEATKSHLLRSKSLERALNTLIIGTASIAIIFLLFLLGQGLSQYK